MCAGTTKGRRRLAGRGFWVPSLGAPLTLHRPSIVKGILPQITGLVKGEILPCRLPASLVALFLERCRGPRFRSPGCDVHVQYFLVSNPYGNAIAFRKFFFRYI